jgi:hypothetical protein
MIINIAKDSITYERQIKLEAELPLMISSLAKPRMKQRLVAAATRVKLSSLFIQVSRLQECRELHFMAEVSVCRVKSQGFPSEDLEDQIITRKFPAEG